ncbi:hypothetical protein J1614_007797 [Plenodomus biglobosus]|nr:hypothetical protein J1614_007797 [Plenodomus biglobosus]
MKFPPNLLTILLLTTLTTTAAHPSLPLLPRGLPGAYYTCVLPNFAGPTGCTWTSPTPRCRTQGPTGIQSLGPDPGTICALFASSDCSGARVAEISFPGLGAGLPGFGSFRCWVAGAEGRVDGDVDAEGARKGAGGVLDPAVLAGGVGSREREEVREEIGAMERDGFSEGLIGLKKRVYY